MTENAQSQSRQSLLKRLNHLILNKIDTRKLWNSLALILGRFSSSGLGFLTWLITARLYATTEVGIASGVISAMMLCVQLALLGLNSAFVALYPKHRQQPSKLLNTTLNIVSLAALVAAFLFLLLSSVMFHELSVVSKSLIYVLLFLGVTLFGTVNTFMDHVSIAIRRGDQMLVRNVLFGVITIVFVAVLPLVARRITSESIILAWMLAGFSACMIGSIQIFRAIPEYHYRLELDTNIGNGLVSVSLKNYLLTLAERAPNWILPIIVTEMLSPTENAYWYTLWMMAWVIYIIPISVGQNLFADVSHQPGSYRQALTHSIKTSLLLGTVAAAAMILLASFLLSLLGTGYASAGTLPLRILALGVYPGIFIQAYYGICRGKNMLTEAILTGTVAGLAGVLAASLVGLRFGLVGMAVAWLMTQCLVGSWALIRLGILSRQNDD
jgi:O-antigen/teichoic acid export membrane protein